MNIKKTRGRLKIEMKKVEHEAKREVTFSKRKKGLFSKAGELCELCGAEVALIIFSPHLKPFTFGNPDANDILHRYLTGIDSPGEASRRVLQGVNAVREEYMESIKRLEEEEKKISKDKIDSSNGGFWWDQGIEDITELDELEQYVESMQKLKKIVQARVDVLSTANFEASFIDEFTNQNLLDQNNNFNFSSHSYWFDAI